MLTDKGQIIMPTTILIKNVSHYIKNDEQTVQPESRIVGVGRWAATQTRIVFVDCSCTGYAGYVVIFERHV